MSMRSFNQVLLIGHVVREPFVSQTKTGRTFANIRVVVNDDWIDENGEYQSVPEYLDVMFWNKLADTYSKLVRVGTRVFIQAKAKSSIKTQEGKVISKEIRLDGRDLIILRRGRDANGL